MAAVACTRWEPSIAPNTAQQGSVPREWGLRLRLSDGSTRVLRNTVIRGDSIVGKDRRRREHAFALSDVASLQQGRFSGTKTAFFVVGVAALIYIGIVLSEFSIAPDFSGLGSR